MKASMPASRARGPLKKWNGMASRRQRHSPVVTQGDHQRLSERSIGPACVQRLFLSSVLASEGPCPQGVLTSDPRMQMYFWIWGCFPGRCLNRWWLIAFVLTLAPRACFWIMSPVLSSEKRQACKSGRHRQEICDVHPTLTSAQRPLWPELCILDNPVDGRCKRPHLSKNVELPCWFLWVGVPGLAQSRSWF